MNKRLQLSMKKSKKNKADQMSASDCRETLDSLLFCKKTLVTVYY